MSRTEHIFERGVVVDTVDGMDLEHAGTFVIVVAIAAARVGRSVDRGMSVSST